VADLLDVAPAQAGGQDAHGVLPGGLGDFRRLGLTGCIEDHGAHGGVS
jgi:hypothetical protein